MSQASGGLGSRGLLACPRLDVSSGAGGAGGSVNGIGSGSMVTSVLCGCVLQRRGGPDACKDMDRSLDLLIL